MTKEKMYEKMLETIQKLRSQNDEKYNQFLLLDHLFDDVDLMLTITNRTDGKTYGHIKTLLHLNKKFGFKFILMARHFTLRKAYASEVMTIIRREKTHGINDIGYKNHEHYLSMEEKGKTICHITDLNSASDLKYRAAEMSDIDLIVYDEFICMEHEYLSYEIDALKVIYETMDRNSPNRILKNPKILCMGNAMNFGSPIIAYYDLFYEMEKQEMNTINIVSRKTQSNQTLKIAIELRCNETVNDDKNSKLFDMGGNNYAISATFNTNTFLIYSGDISDFEFFVIKYHQKFIKVFYSNTRIILSVLDYQETYDYCVTLFDIQKDVKYMNENYFDSEHIYKMFDRSILYNNTYSLQYISDNIELQQIVYEEIVDETMYNKNQIIKMRERKSLKERELDLLARFEMV